VRREVGEAGWKKAGRGLNGSPGALEPANANPQVSTRSGTTGSPDEAKVQLYRRYEVQYLTYGRAGRRMRGDGTGAIVRAGSQPAGFNGPAETVTWPRQLQQQLSRHRIASSGPPPACLVGWHAQGSQPSQQHTSNSTQAATATTASVREPHPLPWC